MHCLCRIRLDVSVTRGGAVRNQIARPMSNRANNPHSISSPSPPWLLHVLVMPTREESISNTTSTCDRCRNLKVTHDSLRREQKATADSDRSSVIRLKRNLQPLRRSILLNHPSIIFGLQVPAVALAPLGIMVRYHLEKKRQGGEECVRDVRRLGWNVRSSTSLRRVVDLLGESKLILLRSSRSASMET